MSTTLNTFDNLNFNYTRETKIKKPLIETSNLSKISLDIVKITKITPKPIQNLEIENREKINLSNSILTEKLPKIQKEITTEIAGERRFLLLQNGQIVENPTEAKLSKILVKTLSKAVSKIINSGSSNDSSGYSILKDQNEITVHQKLANEKTKSDTNLENQKTYNFNFKKASNLEKDFESNLPNNFYSANFALNSEVISNLETSVNLVKDSVKNLYQKPSILLSGSLFLQDISTDFQFCTQIWSNSVKLSLDPKIEKTKKYIKLVIFCAISIFEQMISGIIYRAYLALHNLHNLTQIIPVFAAQMGHKIQKQINNWLQIINKEFARDFWWLELRLETRLKIRKISSKVEKISKSVFFLVRQFYLAIFVISTLSGLFVISHTKSSNKMSTQSLLSKFVEKNTIQFDTISVNAQNSQNSIIDFRSFNSNSKINSNQNEESEQNVKKIIAHTFTSSDNLPKLAELYNLSIETIKFNNKLKGEEVPKIGQILFIPWTNGYIYNTNEEINSSELAKFYKVEEKLLILENKAFWDEKTGKFLKDKLILIPTTNFDQITEFTNAEKLRLENLEKADKQRTQMLNYTAVANEKTSKESNSFGFIWPTVGSISRCVQPGHVACDIANFNSPPIYAVGDGTILSSGWKDGGFGYMTLIDHGNGVQTMYMHMSEVYTNAGEKVKQGQSIGKMGCTGNCSGTHLHFEVRLNKVQQNPLLYLP